MPDMISIFNQLTRQELADCRLFENVLDKHYQKFKYFYLIIEDLKLDGIRKIECQEKQKILLIFIYFKDTSDRNRFHSILLDEIKRLSYSTFAKYFRIEIKEEKDLLNISIENKNFYREEDIYEDRFDTD